MPAETMFSGFERNPYEAEARERWGDEAVDASYERLRNLGADDAELARTGFDRVHTGLAPLQAAGVPVDDERVQELVGLHHRVVSLFWTPGADAYRGLGQTYVDDERYHASIGSAEQAAYLRDAMDVYADARLG